MNDEMYRKALSIKIDTNTGKPSTLNEETRSIEVVCATENIVRVFDYERYEAVDEVLLMSGCQMPESRQVPLLDSHSRYNTSSVIGSCRDLAVENKQLIGRAHYSSTAETEYTKAKEGHLTDYSVGYVRKQIIRIEEKESQEIEGKTYNGPIVVVTKWKLRELSVCPIGADEAAKSRSEKIKQEGKKQMDPKLREMLEKRGLPKDATEEEAIEFVATLSVPTKEEKTEKRAETIDPDPKLVERARITEIDAMCRQFKCDELASNLIKNGTSIEEARKLVMEELSKRDVGPSFHPATLQHDEKDKFRSAAIDGLLIRSGETLEKPASGATELAGYSLRELARKSLTVARKPDGGQVMEMLGRALTTSDLPYILAAAANKALAKGYNMSEETWQIWCDTGSVSDFKTNSAVRASETQGLDEVPEGGEYKYDKVSESREQYSIATYGKIFPITRQTLINDDLGALTDIPMKHGRAAKRKIGDIAYAVLTGNAAMGDGIDLFHASHGNYIAAGSGAVPGSVTIAAAVLAMGTQKDLDGVTNLNIEPKFLIAPKALEFGTEVFFNSNNFSDNSTVATDSTFASTRNNIYANRYIRVYDSRLDTADAAAWYMAAAKGDTVKVFFLNGVQNPWMEIKQGWNVDGVEFKIRIDAGAKAMDWKGLYYNDGN